MSVYRGIVELVGHRRTNRFQSMFSIISQNDLARTSALKKISRKVNQSGYFLDDLRCYFNGISARNNIYEFFTTNPQKNEIFFSINDLSKIKLKKCGQLA